MNENKVQVLQYITGHPYSMFSGQPANKIEENALNNYVVHNYHKRLFIKDYNKEILEYLFLKRSEYLIIDIMSLRHYILRSGDHVITNYDFLKQHSKQFYKDFNLEKYEKVSPYEINEKEQFAVLDKLADEILTRYTPDQIILPMIRGVEQYVIGSSNTIVGFTKGSVENMRKYNLLIERLNEHFSARLKGCHIVEFPDYVLADRNHRWGLYELHYMDLYYEYAAACIEVIIQRFPNEYEKKELFRLRENCSDKFELIRSRIQISTLKDQLKCTNKAMRFFEMLVYDKISDFKAERLKGKAISLLKAGDRAGKLFTRICEENNINIIFSSYKTELSQLTDEEWERCRKCDVVVNCNIHAARTNSRDNIQPIMLSDVISSFSCFSS